MARRGEVATGSPTLVNETKCQNPNDTSHVTKGWDFAWATGSHRPTSPIGDTLFKSGRF